MSIGCLGRAAAVVVGLLLVLVGLLAAAPAQAEDGPVLTYGRQITRYDVLVELDAQGVADVTIDMDFSFGNNPGHGPYIWLPTRQSYDAEQDRIYKVTRIRASSSTGAPAKKYVESTSNGVTIRVGDEDRGNIRGVQQYTISYRLEGMVNGAAGDGTYDEFNWNAIGSGWEIPISDASVTVRGPADVVGAACFAGSAGSVEECTSHGTGGHTALFEEAVLPVGRQLTVVTGWPAGTFQGVDPILEPKPRATDVIDPASPLGIAAGIVLLGGVGTAVTRVRSRGRDEAYLGLTPGVEPGIGQDTVVGVRDTNLPVAVQFEPPRDARPGVIGTLLDEVADPHDVTATLVDLAVRGYLRIDEVPRKNPKKMAKDWTLVRLKDADVSLAAYEKALFDGIFVGRGDEVKLSTLKTTFAATMGSVQSRLYAEVTGRGWFRTDPQAVRARWRSVGWVLVIAAVASAFVLGGSGGPRGFLLFSLALLATGIVVNVCAKHAPARTAAGTAVLAQTLGFKQFIATAEAHQIRWEEDQDIFSRYLPYAIAFGETRRWARVFEDLAAQGSNVAEPSWYTGSGLTHGTFWTTGSGDFSRSLASFSSSATTAISAPAPSSSGGSGGSGFSGGGSSGGGGGGGGGGGW
ncbi:MAG: DUF2207 domain-containing protein [Actinomycetales bacterium]|nr:DUF2207 domain-containing protein [Actinomycetales bacterium]